MPVFKSTIRGHLDLTRKLPELPDVIEQVWVDEVETPNELANLMYQRLNDIPAKGGMNAKLIQSDGGVLKVFVFNHMIAYISTALTVSPTTVMEDPEHLGEFLDNSGNRVRKQ